jgi:hypothetical protein
MPTRNGRTFSEQYHRQVALDDVDEAGDAEFAALLDDYCRRVNEEPHPPRRPSQRPGRAGHA